ncbi:MAG: creatininase family protein [Anaerolineales bacterium]
MVDNIKLWEMTRPQVEAALADGYTTAVATFGATEQHGLHLPLGTDWLWGEELGFHVARALGNALLMPAVRIGRSEHHMDFAGSLTYSEDTFNGIVRDICQSLARHGFREIVLLPTHGGNFKPVGAAAANIRPALPEVNIISYDDLIAFTRSMFDVAARYGFTPEHTGAHAGENETSLILALYPDLVDTASAQAGYVGDPIKLAERIFAAGFKSVTPNGVLGDPAGARAAHGEAYLEALTQDVVEFVRAQRAG